jgi:hypothetical protein
MVCTMLSLTISHSWPVHQLDVKNAFMHGTLLETISAANLLDLLILCSPIASASSTSLCTG